MLAALGLVALLTSLSSVAWRQSRALEVLAGLEAVRGERIAAQARRVSLERRIQDLESRAHIVARAHEQLGMRMPEASEIEFLAGAPS